MNDNQILRILRAGPGHREAKLFEKPLAIPSLLPSQAWVHNLHTLLYTGSDVARVHEAVERELWLDLGCTAIGRVELAGSDCPLNVGELILWNGPHADAALFDATSNIYARVAEPNPHLLLACVAAEATLGIETALAGDAPPSHAIIIGQGMLGHMAGQWLRHRGANVTVVENSPKRLEFSKYLGLTRRIDTHHVKWREKLRAFNPDGAEMLVDACGYEAPVGECLEFLRDNGRLVMLGNWRPQFNAASISGDVAAMIAEHAITVSGPPPTFGDSPSHQQLLETWVELIGSGTIPVDRLITNDTSPNGAVMDLKRLTTGVKSICGVVVNWTE